MKEKKILYLSAWVISATLTLSLCMFNIAGWKFACGVAWINVTVLCDLVLEQVAELF
jgi:hypothetical protein